ncbi:hypothetical protein ACFXDE_04500 [Kitasatospora sp. NPDC059408]|uniref:hypothetical protein n=1 Tax=Kitasatospora sp. NPDC059408 TaxID=3346823 RepID=UPI003685FB3B
MRSPSPWRVPDFRTLFAATTLSQLATSVSYVAVPLIAVSALDATPAQAGLLGALGTAAFPLIGLPAGALAIGAAVAGAIGQLAGVHLALWVGGALIATAFLPVHLSPVRRRDLPPQSEPVDRSASRAGAGPVAATSRAARTRRERRL